MGRSLRAAVSDGGDLEARTQMALASTIAGMAFSGAGVHVPHALAYPIASLKHEWKPPGYGGAALIPHGFAVAVTAPAVFRFIEDAVPERCATAARLLDGGDDLAVSLERLLEDVGAPMSLRELGYGEDDLAAVVQGALDQRRLLVGSPKEIGAAELEALLEGVAVTSASLWPARVAIVGAGTMGVGISHVFASSGIPTVLVDSTPERSEAARERAVELLSRLEAARHRRRGRGRDGADAPLRGGLGRGGGRGRRPDRRGGRRAPRREGRRLRGDRGGRRRRRRHRHEHLVDPDLRARRRGCAGPPASSGCTGSCRRSSSRASR